MRKYDHKAIEKKWQKSWAAKKAHVTKDKVAGKKNEYLLVEFPYPSGNLHVGHWYAFAMPDIYARFRRAQGKNVLYPMGFDAFGLPAENAAIKHGLNPRQWTKKNIAYMKKQLASMGASFDWSREVATIDPEYYKWTQWQFLQFYKNGLAYQKETPANWCPKDKTVLANEQVVDGKCERCGTEVEQRLMLQWNLKITDYADRLVDDLTDLEWPQQIKDSQRNWIGRSEGAEIDFSLADDTVRRFVILHGRNGSPEDCGWLRSELESRGYEVHVPQLPNTQEPDDEEQARYVLEHCTFDEQTAIIGYSMGGIVAMRLLERGVHVQRVTLVATPYTGVFLDRKARKSVTRACQKGFDIATIRGQAKEFAVLADETDTVVPMTDAEQLVELLGARFLRGRGEKPHFTGERERDILWASLPSIRVFTTRPDTLFGATYLVLAPEHPFVTLAIDEQHTGVLENRDAVAAYVAASKKKSELERQESKEKTGVQLEGVMAINPASGEKIPVYIADYVLAGYGTGAIMAVPAHDERDFEFAKKFGLPVREVVEPTYEQTTEPGKIRAGESFDHREAIIAAVQHWSEDKYIALKWKQVAWGTFITGGIELGQTPAEAAMMELREEVGFTDAEFVKDHGVVHGKFYHVPKKTNRNAHAHLIHLKLRSDARVAVDEQEQAIHEVLWLTRDELRKFLTPDTHKHFLRVLEGQQGAYTTDGTLANSGEFDRMESVVARPLMTAKYGRAKKTYRLRDWGVSRQRYWGVPIPIIHCAQCGAVPVPDKDLPVKLPDVKDYLPDGNGKSPLAKATKWVNVKCPQCKGKAQRETDTLDTFVDSSWYFLRYTDPKNKKQFADKKKQANWLPVDLYSGGAEHTTMHLLYSRFWHKALYDLKLVKDKEPYMRRMNRGLILGPDGQKMSKSKGNVIDPDEVVAKLGSDTVRLYLAFIGPYNEPGSYPWNPDSIMGVRRFLERTWRLYENTAVTKKADADVERELHKTIKKVGEDCADLKFNTAIAQMMIFLNAAEGKGITAKQYATFTRLLAPFAPHIAEELWQVLKQKGSVHTAAWPKFDAAKLVADTITIAVQINGKTRAEAKVPQGASKEDQEAAAHAAVVDRLAGQTIQRAIVVPGRLVNFVVD